MSHKKDKTEKGSWVTYRPDIKIHDCTVRDGGLINNHFFEDDFVKKVYQTCLDAGIDYMELGYKASSKIFNRNESGDWKFCDENDMRRIVGDNDTRLKLTVMADAERTDYHTDILPKDQSVLDCIRVATYIHQIPAALDMVKDAHDKGYETTLNLMAVSIVQHKELEEALKAIASSPVDVLYIVDSFGSLYSEQVRNFTRMYLKAMEGTGKEVGIHAHNNQQMAYANTIEALIQGASRLDATINGMGRGAGNCPLESLVGFLHNPKFHIRPILQTVQDTFLPLKQSKTMDWGYSIPYLITGQLNMHPREAIKIRASDEADNYIKFYDQMIEEES